MTIRLGAALPAQMQYDTTLHPERSKALVTLSDRPRFNERESKSASDPFIPYSLERTIRRRRAVSHEIFCTPIGVYFCGLMPLILDLHTPGEHTRVAVWHITEPAAYFTERLTLSGSESRVLSSLRGMRSLEWLASRYTLDMMIDHHTRIETSTTREGKPYLIGRSEEISLSHSDMYVAAMTGAHPVGVDIQKCRQKIIALEHKFAREEESARIDRTQPVQHLHLLWGAKEALYKIYAKGGVRFREHLIVDLPRQLENSGTSAGEIRHRDQVICCTLHYRFINDYVLVYGSQDQTQ